MFEYKWTMKIINLFKYIVKELEKPVVDIPDSDEEKIKTIIKLSNLIKVTMVGLIFIAIILSLGPIR